MEDADPSRRSTTYSVPVEILGRGDDHNRPQQRVANRNVARRNVIQEVDGE